MTAATLSVIALSSAPVASSLTVTATPALIFARAPLMLEAESVSAVYVIAPDSLVVPMVVISAMSIDPTIVIALSLIKVLSKAATLVLVSLTL